MRSFKSIIFTCLVVLASAPVKNVNSEGYLETFSVTKYTGLTIDSVAVYPESQTKFTTEFTVKNKFRSFEDWQLGFYMLRFFDDPNSATAMEICKENTNECAELKVKKRQQAKNNFEYSLPDLTGGYLTILEPKNNFHLTYNESYQVRLRNAEWLPGNISAMPQSFFIYDKDNRQIINIPVSKYINKAYDQNSIADEIKNHINKNWISSETLKKPDTPLIPLPAILNLKKGNYELKNNITIHIENKIALQNARFSKEALKKDLSFTKVKIDYNISNSGINFVYCKEDTKECESILNKDKEGYALKINNNSIFIYSYSQAGGFYAFQTLRQLWNYYGRLVPQQFIVDYPKYKYRGFLLDVARHFFTVNEVKKVLTLLAVHKINTLHLHLADDEGWRIASDIIPSLSESGSRRSFLYKIGPTYLVDADFDITNYNKISYPTASTVYKGYYTKNDIREIIQFANKRQITVIPEIEMPGHARAFMKGAPEYFFDPNDKSRYFGVQGYTDNVLPICKYLNSQNKFTEGIQAIVQEVAHLFNGQTTLYATNNEISLGADEVSKDALSRFFSCNKAPWVNLNVAKKSHLFFNILGRNLTRYKLSGWQQIVQEDNGNISSFALSPDQMGHAWVWMPTHNNPSGYEMASRLSENGYPTVVAFADLSYFDLTYTPQWEEPGKYWATRFSDTHSALSVGWNLMKHVQNKTNIQGVEGALWTEAVPTLSHVMYMANPKLAGLAEAGWTQSENLNWKSLAYRLGDGKSGFLSYLYNVHGIRYRGYPCGVNLEVPVMLRNFKFTK